MTDNDRPKTAGQARHGTRLCTLVHRCMHKEGKMHHTRDRSYLEHSACGRTQKGIAASLQQAGQYQRRLLSPQMCRRYAAVILHAVIDTKASWPQPACA